MAESSAVDQPVNRTRRPASPFVGLHSPLEFKGRPAARLAAQTLNRGLFLPIQAGEWRTSTLPLSTDRSFDYNAALVKRAEHFGFDLVFALSQRMPKGGYGGVFNGEALDSFMSLAAMPATTERIMPIATSHVRYGPRHPLHFARFRFSRRHGIELRQRVVATMKTQPPPSAH